MFLHSFAPALILFQPQMSPTRAESIRRPWNNCSHWNRSALTKNSVMQLMLRHATPYEPRHSLSHPMSSSVLPYHQFTSLFNHYSPAASQQAVSSSLPFAPELSLCTLPSQSPYSSTEVGGRHKTHSCHAGCWMSIRISWYLHGPYQRIGLGGLRVVAGREVCLPVKRVRLVSCNNREAEKKGKCRNT